MVFQVWTAKLTTLFQFSSVGALFLVVYIYSLSLITMAFSLSTMFSKVGPSSLSICVVVSMNFLFPSFSWWKALFF